MVAALSTPINPKPTATAARSIHPTRPPLLPSDPDNAPPRRPKAREVTSRYMSSTSSSSSSSSSFSSASSFASAKRCPSPVISRAASPAARMTPVPASPAAIKRSQSAERRRPATPRSNSADLRGPSSKAGSGGGSGQVTSAQKMLLTSARSMSVSFQGDSFSLRGSRAKPAPLSSPRCPSPGAVRRGTPERRNPASTAATPASVEQHRWPARLRTGNSLSQSVDITDERRKLGGSSTGSVVRALQSSMILDARSSLDGRLSSPKSSNAVPRKLPEVKVEKNSGVGSDVTSDCPSSDGDSVSSQGNSGSQRGNAERGTRGIVVPARFMQETNNRLRRQTEPGSPLSKNSGLKSIVSSPKFTGLKKPGFDSPVSSPKGALNTRGQSPIRGAVRPASPSRMTSWAASSPRGVSPSRARSVVGDTWADSSTNLGSTASVSSFAAEIRKGKIAENRIVDVHAMRLLHNRLLQWRFVNARSDLALCSQQVNAERSLYNAWVSTTRLRESVQTKRFQLQLQRENMKLASILRGQLIYLEEWASTERDYSSSLAGATEALMASTVRLPISGARADIQKMKTAVCSAVDVMQAMASSICLLLSKVGNANSSVAELVNVVAKERVLLDQCRDLLSTAAALQVKEQSVRAHVLQLNCAPANSRDSHCSVASV